MNYECSDFMRETLKRYLLEDEDPEGMFLRVASTYCDNKDHKQRLYTYMMNKWFLPSTPILTNAGNKRGLPISCYLTTLGDSLSEIAKSYSNFIFLSSAGGGVGTDFSNTRSMMDTITHRGNSSGIIPFMKVSESLSLAISQGSLRRGSNAAYLNIHHPEAEEFLNIRSIGGDMNRKCLNLHHGLVLTDVFMESVLKGEDYDIISPKTNEVMYKKDAREMFQNILIKRLETGEPYLIFIDTVNRFKTNVMKKCNLRITQSNLCSEIFLPTTKDYNNKKRDGVCCLASVNIEYYDQWRSDDLFIPDIMAMLDNVLDDFINSTDGRDGYEQARYSAMQERSVGLGAMGLHYFFQKYGVAFDSTLARKLNRQIFQDIKQKCDKANLEIASQKGSCNDGKHIGEANTIRFSNTTAIAPTASISIICGQTSPSIEPLNANIFTQKTLSGNFIVKNKYLEKLLKSKNKNTKEIWDKILSDGGSVKNLDCLSEDEKKIYKTAFEIDQKSIILMASDRQEFIDQGQSLNIFLNSDIEKGKLMDLHLYAYKNNIKALYYLRSKALNRVTDMTTICDVCQ